MVIADGICLCRIPLFWTSIKFEPKPDDTVDTKQLESKIRSGDDHVFVDCFTCFSCRFYTHV